MRGWIVLAAVLFSIAREFIPNGQPADSNPLPPVRIIVIAVAGMVLLAAASGFLTWWFTKYVIDDEELRIETGMLTKRSRRVGFNRIQSVDLSQPLAARLLSLAELKIDAGGDDGVTIRYLSRKDADRLRDLLLARAKSPNTPVRIADNAAPPDPTALPSPNSVPESVITRVSSAMLIKGILTSSDFLLSLLFAVAAVSTGLIWNLSILSMPAVLALLVGTGSMVIRRVIAQFHLTISRTEGGLRITRGLTNLTTRSIPIDRIQAIRIRQPLLWRPMNWFRVDVDVLGYKSSSDSDSGGPNLLLPVASLDQVRAVLAVALPGSDHESVQLTPIPSRARWLEWWSARSIAYGFDERIAVAAHGRLARIRDLVPHGKTQSVEVSQGPLQRRLDLASVDIHTSAGLVSWHVPSMDAAAAREFGIGQVDRARQARRTRGVPPEEPPQMCDSTRQNAEPERELTATHALSRTNEAAGEPQRLIRSGWE